MVGHLLLRGMLLGIVAGLLAFCVAKLYGEPQVEWAVAYEERTEASHSGAAGNAHGHDASHAHDMTEEAAPVSRSTQAGLGLFTGVVVFGAALGGLFSLVFSASYGRMGRLGPRPTAALIALAGFVAVALVPQLKYPANPPAVGAPETIALRTGLYFVLLSLSIGLATAAVIVAGRLRPTVGTWNAGVAAGLGFAACVSVVYLVMPAIQEVPDDFSATVLWDFRVASLGMHAALWLTLGLAFGPLAERALR